jgi:hypothetical protein
MCPRERLVIISYTTSLSFALKRIGPLAAIIITVFYLLILYLFALPNTPKNPFASIYSESLIKTTCQHILLLIGFDTLIYQKYYDTSPILVGHYPHHRPQPPATATRAQSRCRVALAPRPPQAAASAGPPPPPTIPLSPVVAPSFPSPAT